MDAFAGRILHVDLTERKTWIEPLDEGLVRRFLGARGINAYLLWRDLRPGVDPLGPENPLIFGLGPLTGTYAPSSGRHATTAKSPASGLYAKASGGGQWGLEAKLCGLDHLVIHGESAEWVYLWIHDGRVEFCDARHLRGQNSREATLALQRDLGVDRVEVACIGQAGENRVAFAGIMFSLYNTAARCGVGAVMGAKRLKAIALRGHRSVRVAEPEAYTRAVHSVRQAIAADTGASGLAAYGTAVGVPLHIERKTLPSFNFQRGTVENAHRLSGQYLVGSPYFRRPFACTACTVGCHRYTEIKAGPYAGCHTGGPEFETASALGSGCGTGDLEVVIRANELCNLYGLDTISTGSVIQWTMECFQRGVLTPADTGGLDVRWGSADAILTLVRQIAQREGFGALLADGVARAAERVGQGSERWAMAVKGVEQSRNENRFSLAYALAFAVNPRGPDHLMTECIAERGGTPEAREVIRRITGDVKYATSFIVDKRAEIVRWHEDTYAATECLGLCVFMSTCAFAVNLENMAELFRAATGIPMGAEDLARAGRRVVTLERCINVREGATRADDRLPHRTLFEKLPGRSEADPTPFDRKLERMLDEYYELHGWDRATGRPTRRVLEALDLGEVADELARRGRLPSSV